VSTALVIRQACLIVLRAESHTEPAAAYGTIALAAAAAYWLLLRTSHHADDANSIVSRPIGSDFKGVVSIVIWAAAIGLAFLSPWIACSA
jgi:hypothetical protein